MFKHTHTHTTYRFPISLTWGMFFLSIAQYLFRVSMLFPYKDNFPRTCFWRQVFGRSVQLFNNWCDQLLSRSLPAPLPPSPLFTPSLPSLPPIPLSSPASDLNLKILRDDSACPGACQVIQWCVCVGIAPNHSYWDVLYAIDFADTPCLCVQGEGVLWCAGQEICESWRGGGLICKVVLSLQPSSCVHTYTHAYTHKWALPTKASDDNGGGKSICVCTCWSCKLCGSALLPSQIYMDANDPTVS